MAPIYGDMYKKESWVRVRRVALSWSELEMGNLDLGQLS